MGNYNIEYFFYIGQASDIIEDNFFDELGSLLTLDNNTGNNLQCLKIIQLLNHGTVEKGFIIFDIKVKNSSSDGSELIKKGKSIDGQ